jgi:adenylate cyclase
MIVTRLRAANPVHTAQATVLFADLRGYTGMAERLPPARVMALLDEFVHVVATAARNFGGEVFHMAGDGIMAGFGVDSVQSQGATEALSAGHAILRDFAPIAERWHIDLCVESGIGIGLHSGEVAVGVLGPTRRRNTTLVGDTVNVAARLCSRARAGEVLFSCTVADVLAKESAGSGAREDGIVPFLQLPQFELRGRREPIDIWCVPAAARLTL